MENYIAEWTRFAKRVEKQIFLMDGLYSDSCLGAVRDSVEQLKDEARIFYGLCAEERRASFLRINAIGSELKTTAHFANFDLGEP